MNSERIGKLISKLRKEKNLTQKELGDILGVSPKTISKWECGSGLPDISIIKKIAEELDITVEELLDGSQKEVYSEKKDGKMKKNILVIMVILIILFLVISILFIINKNNNDYEYIEDYDKEICRVIRTYDVDSIRRSNDGYYSYITIHEFQVEGVFTVELPNIEADKLEENNGYVFTFKIDEEYALGNTDVLFEYGEIVDIEYTDRVGMDRTSKVFCE